MDVELRSDVDADWLAVRCDDPTLGQALVDLYFRRDGDVYGKRFPAGSVTTAIVARFRKALPPLLRQTAGIDRVPWREALHETAQRFDEAGVRWWLAGSAALAVRGLRLEPRDLDFVLSDADAARAARALADALIEPAGAAEWPISRWFGRAWLGARVEWVGGVFDAVDQPFPTDFGPVAAASLSEVEWEGLRVRVPSLELQRDVSARRGLANRVALIDSLEGHS